MTRHPDGEQQVDVGDYTPLLLFLAEYLKDRVQQPERRS